MEKSVNTTVSLSKRHLMVLDKWKSSTGLSRSKIIRMAIEELADHEIKQDGFSWRLVKPRKRGSRST